MATDSHDWDARDYAAHSSAQLDWARELIAKLQLCGDETVLDIGCGDGRASALIAEQVPAGSVLGIDKSAAMIDLAREQFAPAAPGQGQAAETGGAKAVQPAASRRLVFRQMDAAAIELPRAFDVAFSNAVLHWVEDHEAVLRGVHGCLRPGGRLLFQMGGSGNAAAVRSAFEEVMRRPRWRDSFTGFVTPYTFCSPADYGAWLPRAGFSVVRAELIPKDMRHDGAGFLGWLRTTWFPYTDRLPEDAREAFLDDVTAAYTAACPQDDDGTIHVEMVRLEVEAELS